MSLTLALQMNRVMLAFALQKNIQNWILCCCFLLCFSQCLTSAFCLFTLFSVVNFRSLKDSARIFFPRIKKENLPIRLVSRKGLRNDENLGIFLTKKHFSNSMRSWSRIFIILLSLLLRWLRNLNFQKNWSTCWFDCKLKVLLLLVI